MLWTVAVIADSAQAFYETLVRRLRDEEREVLWRDYIRFGELFGMPRDAAPGSYHEFRVLWDEMWSGGDLHLTQEARAVALAVAFEIPRRERQPCGRRSTGGRTSDARARAGSR
jgi:uncharacterized protein (DUF2236 family)